MKKSQLPSVLPYKLISYSPRIESQVLMTTRKEKHVKMPYITRRDHSGVPEEVGKLIDQFHQTHPNGLPLNASASSSENILRLSRLSASTPSLMSSVRATPQNPPKLVKTMPRRNTNIKTIITVEEPEDLPPPSEPAFEQRKQAAQFEHVCWGTQRKHGHVPSARENAQVCIVDDCLYLYGGQSHVKHRDVSVLNLRSFEWKVIESLSSPPGRLGHSMVVFRRMLVVYGGWVTDKRNPNLSTCSKSLYSYNPKNGQWKKIFVNGKVPPARRHHCALLLGKDMLVFGGMNNSGEKVSSLVAFDLAESMWRCVPADGDDPGPRSHFTMTAAFHPNLLKDSSSSLTSAYQSKWFRLFKNSGVYLFGGQNARGEATNDIFALCFHKNGLKWVRVDYTGAPPSPRYAHSASRIDTSIFIYGGRNDRASPSGFRDLYIFNIESLKWEQPQVFGRVPQARWGHCMVSHRKRILLLGGLNSGEFMSSDVFELETDQEYVEDIKETLKDKQ